MCVWWRAGLDPPQAGQGTYPLRAWPQHVLHKALASGHGSPWEKANLALFWGSESLLGEETGQHTCMCPAWGPSLGCYLNHSKMFSFFGFKLSI